ncbi:MAG: hypothetical protein IKX92_04965 [Clostridia bacterium]|nr:hypothetical protein [Clostridia bacterium]
MRIFTKTLALLLVMAFVFAFAACGDGSDTADSKDTGKTEQSGFFNVSDPGDGSDEEPDDESGEVPEDGNWYDYEGISVLLPEGFTVSISQGVYMATPADYPTHTDNITLSAAEGATIDMYTESTMRPTLEQMLGELNNFTLQKSKKGGVDYVIMSYSFNLNGVSMKQVMYTFFYTGKAVTVTYTSTSGLYDGEFDLSGENIRV